MWEPADEFARKAGLALPPELRPVLARRLRRRHQADLAATLTSPGPAGMALVVLYVVGVIAMSLLGERRGAWSHYRRRLWPAARA